MNVFEAVKQSVTTRQAAEHYGIRVNRNGMACCPFHNDKTPSMKLDKRFHCFGCGADGDVIDFVAALYGLGKKEAAAQLASDFGLAYEDWKPPGRARKPKPRQKSPEEQFREAKAHCFRVLADYLHLLRVWKTDYAPHSPEEAFHPRFVEALQKQAHVEYLLDVLLFGETEEKAVLIIIVASMYYCGPGFPAARHAIKETLYETGVDLIVLEEGLDTRTASRKEVEDYFEEKRCEMHAEIMFAWRKKQGAGFRLTNSVPYGYIRRNGESNMVKDEEVAPYLSEAFSRYASGQKMGDIAKWLNEQNVEPPMRHKKRIQGKPYEGESDLWTSDNLRGLFRNPTYTGATANGSRQIIAENCHEPYMTKEQFYALPCNMQQSENKISTRKKYKKPNPLAKRIICTCGRPLYWHKDKKTGEELFYCSYCRAHKENGKELKAPAASVYKKVIDAMEREHREEEKMYSAIQQGAGRKAIEAVRADSSMQIRILTMDLQEQISSARPLPV